VRYVEEWQTESELRNRVSDNTFTQLIMLMEEVSQPPQVEFVLPRGTKGLEFIEEARRVPTHGQSR